MKSIPIPSFLASKKVWVTAIGAVGAWWGIPEEALAPLIAYIVGQGIADIGKEKAKFEQKNPA